MSAHRTPALVVQGWGPQLLLRNLWLRQGRLALRPLPVCIASRIASREVPLQGFYTSVRYLSCMVPVASARVAQQVPAPVLLVALRRVASVANFFPISAVFALVWGISVSVSGIFALAIVFLGCACGIAF